MQTALYPEARQLSQDEHPFDVPYAHRRDSMLIEPAITCMRCWAISDGRRPSGDSRVQRLAELMALSETLIFNCTGLGARTLFSDEELTPVRGQLEFLLPQPEIDYMTVGPDDIYMFPRHDGILLGGSHERGNWNLDPDPQITERILRENGALFAGMRRAAA